MLRIGLALTAAALALPVAAAHGAATVPNGFVDERVLTISAPTALGWFPNNNMLVASKTGEVDVYRPDGTFAVRAVDFRSKVCFNGERGLVGVAVDPLFASNRFLYLFYTAKRTDCSATGAFTPVNRISRVTLDGSQRMVLGSEVVLVDGIVNKGNAHTGGDLAFGKDGFLYATTGDGGCHYITGACANANTASRERHTLLGKLIRITRDGAIPATNPFPNGARCNRGPAASGQTCAEMFALGLRNPFRFAFDPNEAATKFYINDVGATKWEEIDLGKSGADYGWNVREGHCKIDSYTDCPPPPAGMTDPIFDYRHTTGCSSITGGAFVPNGSWPAPYAGKYMFTDFVCGRVYRLDPNTGGGFTPVQFGQFDTGPVNMKFGPTASGEQALYYTLFSQTPEVRRIRWVGAVNRPPTAALTATPTSGAVPLTVRLDASGSSDPDGDPLVYRFDFGDGTPVQQSSTPAVDHIYAADGTYTASVVAVDDEGAASQAAQVTIFAGNAPPAVRITSPADDYRFHVGDTVTLTAEATDSEDGVLPGDALTWEVERVHNETHSHPFLPPTTGNSITLTAPPPEDIVSTRNSYLLARLTATDSEGQSTTITKKVLPKVVNLLIESTPTGVAMTANGINFRTRTTFGSWPGYQVRIITPARINHARSTFCFWNDGVKTRDRTFTTLSRESTLWAVYRGIC